MFKGMIENYIGLLTPQMFYKYARTNNILLTPEEAKKGTQFIKENYRVVLNNYDYDVIKKMVSTYFEGESSEKMLRLLEITKYKYRL